MGQLETQLRQVDSSALRAHQLGVISLMRARYKYMYYSIYNFFLYRGAGGPKINLRVDGANVITLRR